MPKYGYLVVEGPHDVEFVYRLLRPFGMRRVRFEKDLDPSFLPLIPRDYPPGGDLEKRMPVPLFLQSATHTAAVQGAGGDTRLINTIEERSVTIDFARLTGIGILLDSDTVTSPADRYVGIRDGLRAKGFAFPEDAGVVSPTTPRFGAFVLPDNQTQGTLEDIVLECGQHVYPGLFATATTHVDAALRDQSLLAEDLKELRKPAGRNKAIVGSMASILRPGRAVQNSLQDNRWLRDTALAIPRVKAVQDFLDSLLELTAAAAP
jgi:hypothetical protein